MENEPLWLWCGHQWGLPIHITIEKVLAWFAIGICASGVGVSIAKVAIVIDWSIQHD